MMLGESDEDNEAASKDFDNTGDLRDEKAAGTGGACGDANGGKGERCKNEETEDQFDGMCFLLLIRAPDKKVYRG